MTPRRGRTLRIQIALLALALVAAGCGNPLLWTRYRAERDLWRAQRMVEKLRVRPGHARPAEVDRAVAAFRAIADAHPARLWMQPERLRDRYVRDVAAISGEAGLANGRLEEMRGRPAAALAIYDRVADDYYYGWWIDPGLATGEGSTPPEDAGRYDRLGRVTLNALLARATLLEREGNDEEALAAHEVMAHFPAIDGETRAAFTTVLEAPFRAAAALRRQGRGGRADSVLAAAEIRWQGAIVVAPRGSQAVPELWLRVGRARAARGQHALALDALRRAIAEPAATGRRRIVLTLAQTALDAGAPDTALAYARWAERDLEGAAQIEAMLLVGRAWEVKGPVDSALVAYERVLDAASGAPSGAQARFRRGVLLEESGRWALARGEYRTLAARYPMHDLTLESLERIVAWHLRNGERDLAQIEARRGLESLDNAIRISHNEETLRRARQTRARLLLAVDRLEKARS